MTICNTSTKVASSRKEAIQTGLKLYIGKPCLNGNISPRFLSTGNCTCVICHEKAKTNCRNFVKKKRTTQSGLQARRDAQNKYYKNNKKKQHAYYVNKRRSDPNFYCACKVRSMLARVLTRANKKKNAKCIDLIGYDGNDLRIHLEKQFTKGMSWEKFGTEIEIDHIIPVSKMIDDGITDPAIINALSNLRPMWARENIKKSNKVLTLL